MGKILVVDNNVDVADILRTLLQGNGYEVRVAFDSTSGLKMAQSFLPHVAVVDLGNSTMDTYEVGVRLRLIPGLSDIYLISLSEGTYQLGPIFKDAHFNVSLFKPAAYKMLTGVLSRYFLMRD